MHFCKTVSDGANMTFCIRLFHDQQVAMVERWVHWRTSDDDEAELRCLRIRAFEQLICLIALIAVFNCLTIDTPINLLI